MAAVAERDRREELLGAMWVLSKVCSGLRHSGDTADKFDGEESCVEMGGGRRASFPGVEGQVVAIPGVDGAELQVADDLAHGRIGCGSRGCVVTK